MNVAELSDEETVAILSETFVESLDGLGDATRKRAVLKRLLQLLESSAPQHFIYELVTGCEELEVIRVGDDLRVFCRLVMGVPDGSTVYNVLFVFDVVAHDYDSDHLRTLDQITKQKLRELGTLSSVDDVDEYFDEMDAFIAEDFEILLDRHT